jgi:hypothetical protein
MEKKAAIEKLRGIILFLSKKSGIAARKICAAAKKGGIDRKKAKKIVRLLEGSKKSGKIVKPIIISLVFILVAFKAAKYYNADKSFRENMEAFAKHLKGLAK